MKTIDHVKLIDGEIIPRLKELVRVMESCNSRRVGVGMKMPLETADRGATDEEIEAMKKIGSDFEMISFNLLNIACLIEKKYNEKVNPEVM